MSRQTSHEQQATPSNEAIDFIYEATKEAPRLIAGQAAKVTERALTMLTVGAALLGAAGLSVSGHQARWWVAIPFGLAIVAFLLLTVFTILCVHPRGMRPSLHADTLWRDFWTTPVPEIKWALVEDVAGASKHNTCVLRTKNRWAARVVYAFATEAVLVAITGITALAAGSL